MVLGAGLGFLCVQTVAKTINPYFYYSFPWHVILIYLAILLIVQFILISYTTGNLKKQSLVEQNQSDGITAFRVLSTLNEDADRVFFDTLIEEFCNETPGTTFLSFL